MSTATRRPRARSAPTNTLADRTTATREASPARSTSLATSKFQNLGVNVAYMGGAGRSIYAGYAYLDNEINTPIIAPLLNGYDLVLLQETWKTPDPNPLAPTRVYHEILEAGSLHPFKTVSAPLPLGTDPLRPSALVSDGLNTFSRFPFGEVTRVPWTRMDD